MDYKRPRLLDLFCGDGGAGAGYYRAGFDVVGVDLTTKRRYPFEFHQGDALEFLAEHASEFDAIHASPPCQHASAGTRSVRSSGSKAYPGLIPATRSALVATGLPYVIENVTGSDLVDPVVLCGRQFGLSAVDTDGEHLVLDRHRGFEASFSLPSPPTCSPHDRTLKVGGSYDGARRDKVEARTVRLGGYVPPKEVQEKLLGIDWATQSGLFQAIPPAYTEWVGLHLRASLLLP